MKLKVNSDSFVCTFEKSLAGFGDIFVGIRRQLDGSLLAYVNNRGMFHFTKSIGLLECKLILNFVEKNNIIDQLKSFEK
jgi:hypothetical protein